MMIDDIPTGISRISYGLSALRKLPGAEPRFMTIEFMDARDNVTTRGVCFEDCWRSYIGMRYVDPMQRMVMYGRPTPLDAFDAISVGVSTLAVLPGALRLFASSGGKVGRGNTITEAVGKIR